MRRAHPSHVTLLLVDERVSDRVGERHARLIFIPLMNACSVELRPASIATKCASLHGPCICRRRRRLRVLPQPTWAPLPSTVHVAPFPPGPLVMLNWKTHGLR